MSIQSCIFFLLASSVSCVQAQVVYHQNSTGRIIAGCIVGGFFLFLFLLFCLLLFSGRRRRSRMAVEGPINQHENKPFRWGRSHPVQQNAMSTTSYGHQGMAQTSAPPVRSDAGLSNAHYYSQGVPPPPAYVKDPNVNGSYSASDGNGPTNDIPYNPPPFPPAAHLNGQENTFVGGFRS